MNKKPGRNAPCYCGSGKKYKNCHMKIDNEAKSQQISDSSDKGGIDIEKLLDPKKSFEENFINIMNAAKEDSYNKDDGDIWRGFESADIDNKISIFKKAVDDKKINKDLAFDMIDDIRIKLEPNINIQNRPKIKEIIDYLKDNAPDVYSEDEHYYNNWLIQDALDDERWDDVSELFKPFINNPEKNVDTLFRVIDKLAYFGQYKILIDGMTRIWDIVKTSEEITPWGVDEFAITLSKSIIFSSIEDSINKNLEDSYQTDAEETLKAVLPYTNPDREWFNNIFYRLKLKNPSPWHIADFNESVDAEKLDNNITSLLYEFISYQYRKFSIPIIRGDLFVSEMLEVINKQMTSNQRKTKHSRYPYKKHKRRQFDINTNEDAKSNKSPIADILIPTNRVLDEHFAKHFNILNVELYKPSAFFGMLPSYLHFIASLGLITQADLRNGFGDIQPLIKSIRNLMVQYMAPYKTIKSLDDAWADENILTLCNDPELSKIVPINIPSEKDNAPVSDEELKANQIYTFKIEYEYDDEVQFTIAIKGNQNLDDLHRSIIRAVKFDSDHLYSFFLSNRAWDKSTEYCAPFAPTRDFFSDDRTPKADTMKICDLNLRMKQKILYIYDYGDEHRFEVQLISVSNEVPEGNYPKLIEKPKKQLKQYEDW